MRAGFEGTARGCERRHAPFSRRGKELSANAGLPGAYYATILASLRAESAGRTEGAQGQIGERIRNEKMEDIMLRIYVKDVLVFVLKKNK